MAISSWSLVRVYGTWTDHQGMLLTGNYKIKVPTRLTNSAADIIIPAGVFASGTLNTTAGVPSPQRPRLTPAVARAGGLSLSPAEPHTTKPPGSRNASHPEKGWRVA